jgi:hypothetical protein
MRRGVRFTTDRLSRERRSIPPTLLARRRGDRVKAYYRCWHFSEVTIGTDHVRCWGKSGLAFQGRGAALGHFSDLVMSKLSLLFATPTLRDAQGLVGGRISNSNACSRCDTILAVHGGPTPPAAGCGQRQLANQLPRRPEIQPHGRLETGKKDPISVLPPNVICARPVSSRDQSQIEIFVACFDQYARSEAVHHRRWIPCTEQKYAHFLTNAGPERTLNESAEMKNALLS